MERRFYPPKEKKQLLDRLIEDDSPFSEYRDVLFFAAVLGWLLGTREPLDGRGEGIRWEVMRNRLGTEAVAAMIAAAAVNDPEVLAGDRGEERIMIVEEYANGGLSELERRLALEARSKGDVILDLIQEHLAADEPSADGVDLTKSMLTW